MAGIKTSAFALAGLLLAACASSGPKTVYVGGGTDAEAPIVKQKIGRPYQVSGRWYTPARQDDYSAVGQASWYGDEFHGRPTANGEVFDMNKMTAAHPTLPIPSYVEVTNLDNGRTAILRVNDRGPFARNRILDVSRRAAEELGFKSRGTANVRVTYLGPRENELGGTGRLYSVSAPAGPAPVAAPTTPINVEPITRAPSAPISRPAVDNQPAVPGWFIQAGAFSEPHRAESVRAQLGGVGPSTIETVSVGGQTLHRVLVGPYPAEMSANAARYQVAGAGFGDARLILRN
mgnify:CR=1 FL=1